MNLPITVWVKQRVSGEIVLVSQTKLIEFGMRDFVKEFT